MPVIVSGTKIVFLVDWCYLSGFQEWGENSIQRKIGWVVSLYTLSTFWRATWSLNHLTFWLDVLMDYFKHILFLRHQCHGVNWRLSPCGKYSRLSWPRASLIRKRCEKFVKLIHNLDRIHKPLPNFTSILKSHQDIHLLAVDKANQFSNLEK